jgi:ADP-ribose pyrophosphatase
LSNKRIKPWTVQGSREVFRAGSWFKVFREEIRLPNGRVVKNYHRIDGGDHVAVCAETTENKFVLVRQYRHGARRVCLGLPAGAVNKGESPLKAAQRELLEETGYVGRRWTCLGKFPEHGNYGCGTAHLFKTVDAKRFAAPNSGDLEEMEVVLMSMPQLKTALRNNRLPLLGAIGCIALATDLFCRNA